MGGKSKEGEREKVWREGGAMGIFVSLALEI